MDPSIIVALISLAGSVIVAMFSYSASRRGVREASEANAKLIAYKLEELQKKVDKHNNMVERTYKLEGQMAEVQHDIRDIKAKL